MFHFTRTRDDVGQVTWEATSVEGERHDLIDPRRAGPAFLLRSLPGASWVLVEPSGRRARVNGLPVATGLRVLRDRDEIQVDDAPASFVSLETPARIETYEDDDAPACPRCTIGIERGQRFVRCPDCGLRLHEAPDAELPCWTAEPACPCGRTTDLAGGPRWTPEAL